jgi:hypothetical protein
MNNLSGKMINLLSDHAGLIDKIEPFSMRMLGNINIKPIDMMGSWTQEKEDYCRSFGLQEQPTVQSHFIRLDGDAVSVILTQKKEQAK